MISQVSPGRKARQREIKSPAGEHPGWKLLTRDSNSSSGPAPTLPSMHKAASHLPEPAHLGGSWGGAQIRTHPEDIYLPSSAAPLSPALDYSPPADTHKSRPAAPQLTQRPAPRNPPFSRLQLKGRPLKSKPRPVPDQAISLRRKRGDRE